MAEFGEARRELRDRNWVGMGRGDGNRGLGMPETGLRGRKIRSGQGLVLREELTVQGNNYWDLRIGFEGLSGLAR